MIPIYLFTDYRNQFYSSTKYRGAGVNLDILGDYLKKEGYELIVRPFGSIDFKKHSYKDSWVLYQSSEDPGLHYRSYIDDVVMGLFMQGARLIPNIFHFRAHHNKVFMEIVRDQHSNEIVKNIQSKSFGTYDDYVKRIHEFADEPYVLKAGCTSKSSDVHLLSSEKERITVPKKVSHTFSTKNFKYIIEWLKTGIKPRFISNFRKKFILQQFIPGLEGDYRVLVYGEKYYFLYRKNRKRDFRASGSMRFDFNVTPPDGILDFSRKTFQSFDVPFMALDIAYKNGHFYLLEFQFLSFGQYTLEKSKFYYGHKNGQWLKVDEAPNLEREIAVSVGDFTRRHS